MLRHVGWRVFDQKCGTCHCFGSNLCYWATCWTFLISYPGRDRGNLFTPTLPDHPWGPPSPLYNGYLLSLPGIKRPGSEVYNSPPSNTEVKNAWSCTSSASIYLRGVERDGFIFTLNLQLPRCQNLKSRIFSLVCGPIHDIFTGSLQYQLARDVPTVSSFSQP